MPPHHAAGIAHEAAELGDGARIGFVEVTPGRALVPGRYGRADRRLVERRRALQQAQLGRRFHRAREHQRVIAVGNLKPLDLQADATGKSRFESSIVRSTSHTQRSDLTASGETTKTTVSDCSIRPPRRVSQSSPATMSWRSRKGAKPATSSPATNSSANAAESLRE